MKKIILLNKKQGETPLECLERFRDVHKQYKNIKMTYAGRLDPMASGLLLILAGGEIKNKDKYLKLDKEYEFEILFGFATDTYDILGKVNKSLIRANRRIVGKVDLKKLIQLNLTYFKGTISQKYPAYSSKTWERARAGRVVESESRAVKVFKLNFTQLKSVSSKKLLTNIERRVKKVNGDFRQKEILKIWRKNLSKNSHQYFIGNFKIKCSSGTYVRGIANSLGENINIPALAFSIKRTKLGKWGKI